MARQRNVGLAACWVLVLTAAPVDAFLHHAPVGGAVGRPASCARVAPASRFQMSTLDDLRNQVRGLFVCGRWWPRAAVRARVCDAAAMRARVRA